MKHDTLFLEPMLNSALDCCLGPLFLRHAEKDIVSSLSCVSSPRERMTSFWALKIQFVSNHMSLFYFLIFLECQFNLEAQTSTFTHNCLLLPRYDSQRQNDNSGRALKRDRQPKVAVLRLARIWKLLGGFLIWRPLFVWIISPPTFLRKFFLFIRTFLYFWSLSSPFMCKRS